MVAACINADTGVGPSIASANQVWKKIWADLALIPIKKKIQIRSTWVKPVTTPKIFIFIKEAFFMKLDITENEKELDQMKSPEIPKTINISPILFTITAFIADLIACNLVLQKLIKIKEQIPTPSQPTNKNIKLSEETSKFIKKVKSDKKLRKLTKKGSFFIYSVEYKWTTKETTLTTTNIAKVKESKTNEKLKYAVKEKKNLKNKKFDTTPSKLNIKEKKDKKALRKLEKITKYELPFLPKVDENKNKNKNVIIGIITISKLMRWNFYCVH